MAQLQPKDNFGPLIRSVLLKALAPKFTRLPSSFCPLALCFSDKCRNGCPLSDDEKQYQPFYYEKKVRALVNGLAARNGRKRNFLRESVLASNDADKQNKLLVDLVLYFEALLFVTKFIMQNMNNILTDDEVLAMVGAVNKEQEPEGRVSLVPELFDEDSFDECLVDEGVEKRYSNLTEPEF